MTYLKNTSMDQYLVPGSSFIRLFNEYKQHGSIAVAYDFDNTVYDYHLRGNTYTMVMQLLRDLKEIGCVLICFTANEDEDFVKDYCKIWNIPLDKLNENPDFYKSNSKKIYYNTFLDDRAGLLQVYEELALLVYLIKNEKSNS